MTTDQDDERALRTDLCVTCKDPDHVVCWDDRPDPTCACCRSTIVALEDTP